MAARLKREKCYSRERKIWKKKISPNISLDDEYDYRQHDEMKASEAIFQRHEHEMRLGWCQINLNHVHVSHISHQEDHAERSNQEELDAEGRTLM